MKYELETVVTVEATNIAKAGDLPDREQLNAWKKHITDEVSARIGNVIGDENYTARVKVQVFIHEKEAEH